MASNVRTIERIEVFPVRLPMTASFSFASGSAGKKGGTAPHVFVKLTDSQGGVGWGEARPVPQWSYETQESVVSTIAKHLAPAVTGLPLSDRFELHRRMHAAVGRGPSTGQPIAKAAVDIAVHDAAARAAGQSLRTFLGGSDARDRVDLSYTLTAHDASEARDQLEAARAQGFKHFNFKAAVDRATDIAVARAVCEAAPAGAFIWADANQGFAPAEAAYAADAFHEAGVHVLEQPLPADRFELMRALRKKTKISLAVDEACVSPGDFFRYAAEGLVDYLVIKVTRSGGLFPSREQIAIAEAAGLPLLLSGLTDGFTTKQAACQLALAFGFGGSAALNGSQFIDESALFPAKSKHEAKGSVHLNASPGVGIMPDEGALESFLAKELLP